MSINNTCDYFTRFQNPYVDSLLTMFVNMTRDEDEDVRNNAVYGAGELALHGGQVKYFIFLFSIRVIFADLNPKNFSSYSSHLKWCKSCW